MIRKINKILTNIVEKILKKSTGKTQSLTSGQSAQYWDGLLDAVWFWFLNLYLLNEIANLRIIKGNVLSWYGVFFGST